MPNIPAELKDHIDSETFDKTRRYNLAKNTFGYVSETVSTVQNVVTLLFLQPLIWEAAAHVVQSALVERLGLIGAESSTALAYAQVVAFLIMGSVVDLPLSLLCKIYSTFIIVRAPKLPSVSCPPRRQPRAVCTAGGGVRLQQTHLANVLRRRDQVLPRDEPDHERADVLPDGLPHRVGGAQRLVRPPQL